MNRRQFLGAAATMQTLPAQPQSIPIIDTHVHLFDPRRPGGIPWPAKDDTALYKPALPDRYRAVATPFGIRGAIEVEASPRREDNDWVLETIQDEPLFVGTIGNLEPAEPGFAHTLQTYLRNPLFLGIRYGNLWSRDLGASLAKPDFVAGVKSLAAAGLILDTANPTPALLADVVRLTDAVPNLRVMLDHLPQLASPTKPAERRAYDATVRQLTQRPQVFVKVSSVLRRVDSKVPTDPAFYKPRLDELWAQFGEDRLVYGSDWPNSDHWAEYPQVFRIVDDYFRKKGPEAAAKYFWKNSKTAYRWKKRSNDQPGD
ncbi:amidohydrolase family protein [Paludibaculum fermentans]|uniref:Amidohydrolase family protein n=1 Tax=Paludibaculum fermentans TaxID=1473598 RepID=A0A7S7NTD0_PALFE|nr:amidohydrolase family protein [Paludibaculum fermentans]QOY89359.1 amidohydrolase family protein [Paludibaculum fermentans]